MSTTSIDSIRADVEESGSLLSGFYSPWDADDNRPLWILKDALCAQQRALESLLLLIESDRKINAAHRGRTSSLELSR